MARLDVFAEGSPEQTFASQVLIPHLADHGVYVHQPVLIAHARKKRVVHRGGGRNFRPMQNDIVRFLKQESDRDVFFTSMVDLYALPTDFPGTTAGEAMRDVPHRRVETIEAAWAAETGDPRFIPHVQLHEFEAYLFADIAQLGGFFENRSAMRALQKIADAHDSPELIDDGQHTAPSKRIETHIRSYKRMKPVAGPQTAQRIGLPAIRAACLHFRRWLTRLEKLGAGTQ